MKNDFLKLSKYKHKLFALVLAIMCFVCFTALPASAAENDNTVSGVWEFNDTLVDPIGFKQFPAFSSNGREWTWITSSEDGMWYWWNAASGRTEVFNSETGWIDDSYRTIDFGDEPQVVSEEVYKWLTANASKYEPPSPFQLLLNDIGAIFTAAIGFVSIVASTVVGNPILLLFCILSVVGIGIGMFKRLINVKG